MNRSWPRVGEERYYGCQVLAQGVRERWCFLGDELISVCMWGVFLQQGVLPLVEAVSTKRRDASSYSRIEAVGQCSRVLADFTRQVMGVAWTLSCMGVAVSTFPMSSGNRQGAILGWVTASSWCPGVKLSGGFL